MQVYYESRVVGVSCNDAYVPLCHCERPRGAPGFGQMLFERVITRCDDITREMTNRVYNFDTGIYIDPELLKGLLNYIRNELVNPLDYLEIGRY